MARRSQVIQEVADMAIGREIGRSMSAGNNIHAIRTSSHGKVAFEGLTVRKLVVANLILVFKDVTYLLIGIVAENFVLFKFTVQLLVNHRKHTGILTTHVMEVTQIIETVHAGNVQHNTSNFSIRCFKPDSLNSVAVHVSCCSCGHLS